MSDTQPRCIEASVSTSIGGKVQIVKFEFSQDYFISFGGKWDIPEDWTEDQVDEFRREKYEALREKLEVIAQEEVDALMEQRDSVE
jgi:hypothetical protein